MVKVSEIDGKIGITVLNFVGEKRLQDGEYFLLVEIVKIEDMETAVAFEELGEFGRTACSCLAVIRFELSDGVGTEFREFVGVDERIRGRRYLRAFTRSSRQRICTIDAYIAGGLDEVGMLYECTAGHVNGHLFDIVADVLGFFLFHFKLFFEGCIFKIFFVSLHPIYI